MSIRLGIENPTVGGGAADSVDLTGTFVHNFTTFTDGDATPSVADGYGFKTANTSLTTITNFDDGVEGQVIKIIIEDAYTAIQNNSNIKLMGGGNYGPGAQYDSIQLTYEGSVWVEDRRSNNS